jgi:hypothetical protein
VAAVVGIVYAAILLPRLAAPGGVYTYVHFGTKFMHLGQTSGHPGDVISPTLPTRGRIGFDGQFFYFMAVDPAHAKYYMDMPAYRWSRPLYPFLARGLSGGNPTVVPYMLLFINLVAIAAGTLAVAIFLKRRRLSPWYALLYGFFPGLTFGVVYDIAEPLGYALVAWAVVVFDRHSWRRLLLSAVLFALALLARETVALIPAVLVLSLLVMRDSASSWRAVLPRNVLRAGVFAAVAFVPMFAWRFYVPYIVQGAHGDGQAALVKQGGIAMDNGEGLSKDVIPLHGIFSLWPWNNQGALVFATVIVPGVLTLVLMGRALLKDRTSPELWLVLLSAAVFILFIPSWMLKGYGNGGRVAIGVVVPLILALPKLNQLLGSRSRMLTATLLLWSAPFWFVAAAASSGLGSHKGKMTDSMRAPAVSSPVSRPHTLRRQF